MVAILLLLTASALAQPGDSAGDSAGGSSDESAKVAGPTPTVSDQAGATADESNTSPDAAPIAPNTPTGELRVVVDDLEPQVRVSTELDDATRDSLLERLTTTRSSLDAVARLEAQSQKLVSELERAAAEMEEVERLLGGPLQTKPLPTAETILEWETELATAEADLAQRTLELRKLTGQIATRNERRQAIPALLEDAMTAMAELEARLDAPPSDQIDLVTQVEANELRARQLRLDAEIALLRQEARTYEATTRLLSLKKDAAARAQRAAADYADRVRAKLMETREQAASDRVGRLRELAAEMPPALRDDAEANVELAQKNLAIVEELDRAVERIARGESLRNQLVREFTILEKRVGEAGLEAAIGSQLRSYRSTLSAATRETNEIAELEDGAAIEEAIAAVRQELDAYEDEKTELLLAEADSEPAGRLLAARRLLLLDLIDNGSKKLDRLTELASLRESLRAQIERQSQYVAEQILWVRSAPPLGPSELTELPAAFAAMLDAEAWGGAFRSLIDDAVQNPAWLTLAGLLAIASLFLRRRLFRVLKACCDAARKPTITTALPTVEAFAASLLLAMFLPGVAWLFGWRLEAACPANTLGDAVGYALRNVAALGFVLEFVRIVTRPHGLGESHFGWPPEAMASVRRILWLLIVTALPAVFITLMLRHFSDESAHHSLGRVAYLVAAAAFAYAGWRLLRRRSPVMEAARERSERSIFARLRWVWATLAIGGPVALAIMAIEGHYYTAQQFAIRGLQTAASLAMVLFVQAMLNRVLLVTYRGLAIRRAKEKRAERQAQQEALGEEDGEPRDVIAAPIDEAETPLTDVSEQNQKLIRIVTALAIGGVVLACWSDILPALEWIGQKSLYKDQVAIESGLPAAPTVDQEYVTVLDLVIAAVLAVLTVVAARNLPGLLEIALLQRMPLDAGARYAAAAIARYVIATLGVILAFRIIGVGWSSVQWLVAGVSVGLGFGLQEIFANFVSGLILLFERPIRVGDTVTINDITGSVTRIRIRATTVLDWDNREMVLPNKDFVTGNLINWTLSNPNVRVVQTVGIAYGSDTELATKLLRETAEANPRILDEPPPLVVFTEFGDNSLTFELRFFVTGLQAFRTVKHDLNMAIDRAFRDAEIEISFPQRDLHLRSVSDEIREAIQPRDVFAR